MSTDAHRLRSGKACLGCRRRKSRCDAVRPRCSYCAKRNFDCVYAAPSRRGAYLASLEGKVRRLERELRRRTPTSVSPPSSNGNLEGALVVSTDIADDDIECDSDGEWQVQPGSLDIVEHDGASVHILLSDCGLSPSISSGNKNNVRAPSTSDRARRRSRIGSVIRAQNELHSDNFVLPPHSLAKDLVDLFFEHAFPLFPFVHEPTFRRRFTTTYEANDGEIPETLDIPWQSTMNLIFALGCDYLDFPLHEKYELSQTFHRRGAELILSLCFDTSTLDVIQALLLLSAHLQSNMQFNRFWSSMGCILRSAQGLGFHIDRADWDIGPIEKEMRRRLWWGIYSLDRFVSLKHGRPPAVISEALPVGPPATVHDECITDVGISDVQSHKTPSSIHFFNAVVQLAHIAETMLAYMLKEAPWCLPGQGASHVRELDPIRLNIQVGLVVENEGKLSMWLSELPGHLQFDTETANSKVRRQQKMLRVRYLHLRLMSHRPNLLSMLQACRDNSSESVLGDDFLKSVVMASVRQCVDCACKIVTMLKDTTDPENMGAWWYHLPQFYTALGTLFAIQGRDMISPHIDCATVDSAINTAIEYLDQLGDVSGPVARCRRYFKSLKARWEKRQSPRSIAMHHGMQGHTSVQDMARGTEGVPGFSPAGDDLVNSLGDFLYDSTQNLFLEPLLPDFLLDM